MDLKPISGQLTVSPQISVDDVQSIQSEGFRVIICNRPDGEDLDRAAHPAIQRAARQAGLAFIYQPVRSDLISDQDAIAFGRYLNDAPGPVLAYCRTGTRCAMLWALSQAGQQDPVSILSAARAAGYDLNDIEPRLPCMTPWNTR